MEHLAKFSEAGRRLRFGLSLKDNFFRTSLSLNSEFSTHGAFKNHVYFGYFI